MTDVFYAINPFGTGDQLTGSPDGSITSNILTLDVSQTGNIGIGYVFEIGGTDYYISSVISPSSFTVTDVQGGPVTDIGITSVASVSAVFASLSSAESSYLGASFLNTSDLVTGQYNPYFCCYYDQDDYTLDTSTALRILGATSNSTYFLTIICPNGGTESINKQRTQTGKFDVQKYVLDTNQNEGAIRLEDSVVKVRGLQICNNDTTSSLSAAIRLRAAFTQYDVEQCLLIGGRAVVRVDQSGTLKLNNNIIKDSGSLGGVVTVSASSVCEVNYCNVIDCARGLDEFTTGAVLTAKNCAVFNNSVEDYRLLESGDVTYSASDDNDVTGTGNFQIHSTYTDLFEDFTNRDLRLKNYTGAGALIESADPISGITEDFLGNTRDATSPDSGAFEYSPSGPIIVDETITEGVLLSDTIQEQLVKIESLSETAKSSDTNINQMIFGEISSETAKAGATLEEIIIKLESITEAILAGETINEVGLLIESLSDSAVATDFIEDQVIFTEVMTESTLVSDLIQDLMLFGEVKTETAIASDSDGEEPAFVQGPVTIIVSTRRSSVTIESKKSTITLNIRKPSYKVEIQ